MITAPAVLTVIKYGFLSLVVTGAGFLIANTAITMRHKTEMIEDLAYKPWTSTENNSSLIDKNSFRCLTKPRRPFCLMTLNKKLEILQPHNSHGEEHRINVSKAGKPRHISPVYELLEHFKNLLSSLNVEPMLLEPSMLFCMVTPLHKYALISSGLKPRVLRGSSNLFTFGVMEKDARILNEETSVKKVLQLGYEFSRARKWLGFPQVQDEAGSEFFTTHYFFSRQNVTVQLVVFFQRGTFLWHPGISATDFDWFKSGFFTRNFAYENSTAFPLLLENGKESGFLIPSETVHFLFQIQHSEFQECTAKVREDETLRSALTIDQLNQRVLIVIQELKQRFKPLLGIFLLWSDTLTGWNESCNVFQKTTDFNIAVQNNVISRMSLNATFMASEYLQLLEHHQRDNKNYKYILDCHGLRINIFPTYEDMDSVWNYEANSTGHLTRISYSKFRLCSTDLLGQLVHVPCERELKRELTTLECNQC